MNEHAYVFDAYGTLFDVHSVKEKIHEYYPDYSTAISQEWRTRQIHYFLVRQLIDGYESFDIITRRALIDALQFSGIEADPEKIQVFMEQYKRLKPYPEVEELAVQYPQKKLTIFSNGTRNMLKPLLDFNELSSQFELLSADDTKIYKPHKQAYQYAQDHLDENKDKILFFSSNPWDIAGAAQFGFHTAWVNRGEEKWPELGIEPTYILHNLKEVSDA
ncbi:haloacid dehalogenase type II [Halobacillus salinarum]|uniref:Haloacid dehalogenase type II n=1 Tax=Halobacillus salinarum TaxID=2932257 RepID=A0ABY4EMZ9_9BACI|nr:haloacid dehalogenase type II [Halobacillus salinarum]UOQ45833.1 haloacid dehalogenase type II [Halobacillus salinarum]